MIWTIFLFFLSNNEIHETINAQSVFEMLDNDLYMNLLIYNLFYTVYIEYSLKFLIILIFISLLRNSLFSFLNQLINKRIKEIMTLKNQSLWPLYIY